MRPIPRAFVRVHDSQPGVLDRLVEVASSVKENIGVIVRRRDEAERITVHDSIRSLLERGLTVLFEDDVDAAAHLGAGVLLTQPMELGAARSRLGPRAVIGVVTREILDPSQTRDADFAAIGPIYRDSLSPNDSPLMPARFVAVARRLRVPAVAFGGLVPRTTRTVSERWARGFVFNLEDFESVPALSRMIAETSRRLRGITFVAGLLLWTLLTAVFMATLFALFFSRGDVGKPPMTPGFLLLVLLHPGVWGTAAIYTGSLIRRDGTSRSRRIAWKLFMLVPWIGPLTFLALHARKKTPGHALPAHA